jgi:hypothetical protein
MTKGYEPCHFISRASDIKRLCKRLDLSDGEGMPHFIQGLHPHLRSHVILGQPKSLAEAKNQANLKNAVSINTPNIAQQKFEVQLQSVAKSFEALAMAQQNKTPNVAAYNMHSRLPTPDLQHYCNYQQQSSQHSSDIGPQHDSSEMIAKLVRDEARRQTQFVAPTNRPSNTGIPSSRNRRTTDGIPMHMQQM